MSDVFGALAFLHLQEGDLDLARGLRDTKKPARRLGYIVIRCRDDLDTIHCYGYLKHFVHGSGSPRPATMRFFICQEGRNVH